MNQAQIDMYFMKPRVRTRNSQPATPFQGLGKYGAIYMDPPWEFKTYSAKGITARSAESKYATQGMEYLKTLPVQDLAAKDCVMFMWVVDSHLDQGIELMRHWGFEYKTIAFIWVKTKLHEPGVPRMGMGHWTRKEAEVCIMGTRGKPKREGKGVREVIMEPRREHSQKPECAHDRIKALVAGPYVELFARAKAPGWTVWGNQTDMYVRGPRVRTRPARERFRRLAPSS